LPDDTTNVLTQYMYRYGVKTIKELATAVDGLVFNHLLQNSSTPPSFYVAVWDRNLKLLISGLCHNVKLIVLVGRHSVVWRDFDCDLYVWRR